MQSECRVLKPLRGAALAGAGHHRLLGAARKDNVCFPVEMLIVKLPLSSHTLSGECLFSPGRESPPGSGRWSLVSVFPAPLLTPNSRHVGEQSHLAAGEGLVLALSMSWPVASVRPVPIMPALSLSSPETRGAPCGRPSSGVSCSCLRALARALLSPPPPPSLLTAH